MKRKVLREWNRHVTAPEMPSLLDSKEEAKCTRTRLESITEKSHAAHAGVRPITLATLLSCS